MPSDFRTGTAKFIFGKPMEMAETTAISELTTEQQETSRHVADVIKEYLRAGREMLANRYANVAADAPSKLGSLIKALVFCCPDGVLVRYEQTDEPSDKIFVAWINEPITDLIVGVSEGTIFCLQEGQNPEEVVPEGAGIEVKLGVLNPDTSQMTDLASQLIRFQCILVDPPQDLPTNRPFCLLAVESYLTVYVEAETIVDPRDGGERQHFIIKSRTKLPLGWESIEIYPALDLKRWIVGNAQLWAENDILTGVLRSQLQRNELSQLDPNFYARAPWLKLLQDYTDHLSGNPKEEVLQKFLKDNPGLLCPLNEAMWPKLPLGSRITDYVFREAGAGEYVLVELERPSKRLFLANGDTAGDLNHARDQIMDWRRYLEDNLGYVQKELGLKDISSNPKALIVIGRSSDLTEDDRRKLISLRNQEPRLEILTYDDVRDRAQRFLENVLGPLWPNQGATEIYFLPKKG